MVPSGAATKATLQAVAAFLQPGDTVIDGIEYSMMQDYAEGFELMSEREYLLDLGRVADLRMHGSVVRS
jgi:6-phosphogluconate dehydrogenase (decarboxylating)